MRLLASVLSLAICANFVGSAEAGLFDFLRHHDHGCCATSADCCQPEHSCCAPAPTCCAPAPSCCGTTNSSPAPESVAPAAAPAPPAEAAASATPAPQATPVAAPSAEESGWISLFNGQDLSGWKVGDQEQSKIHVEDGMIVAAGPRSHIFTEKEFKNFEFEAEVKTTPGSNSGLYFHTKYQEKEFPKTGFESQVNVSHGDPVKTGSLYNLIKLFETPAKDNEWWTQRIVVKGSNVTVSINGKKVIDYTEPEGVTGPRNKLASGSFAIQAHDPKSVTYYRNLRVKPLAD